MSASAAPLDDPPRAPDDRPATGAVHDALVAQSRELKAAPPLRSPDVDEKHLLNPAAMVRSPNLVARAMSWLAFRRVAFDDHNIRTIREQAHDGDVVYVMNHHSLLDYLYFNYAFLRFGLPLVFFANKISMTPFRPLWRMIVYGLRRLVGYFKHRLSAPERLSWGLSRGRPAVVFLKTRTLWPWAAEKTDSTLLETCIDNQLERMRACEGTNLTPRPIRIVPQLLIWTPSTNRFRKSFWDTVFGNPEAPGRFRKLLNFIINRRRAFVQVGKPIDLLEYLRARADTSDTADLARGLRFEIHRALSLEERVIKGPVLKRAKRLREEILESPRVREAMSELASISGKSDKQLKSELRGYLKEMNADFSMAYVEVMCILMTLIFSRLYSEMVLDREGLEKVREAGRQAPLVLLPCHRSHVDYLVLSYMFYANGLIPPHVAAGKNLNFFPIGHIFRRAGAFFLRRSFKDNAAYSLAFREYIRKLVKEGYWIEFFIEGGRSRTGKMLPPKFGMLKIIVDAVRGGAAHDVHLVPIYVGYEHVIEERTFTKELRGGEKKKENITALLNATQVLWAKYGRLYVNFADPISCREALDQAALPEGEEDTPESRRFLTTLGYRVSAGINRVAVVTPSALAATALLIHDKRGVAGDVLLARVGFLLELASKKGAPLSKTLEHALRIRRQEIAEAREEVLGSEAALLALGEEHPVARARGRAVEDAIMEVLGKWVTDKHLETHAFDDDEVVWALKDDHRIHLDFYKNNMVHLLVSDALMATGLLATLEHGATTLARLTEAVAFLSRTFRHEFVFDPVRGFGRQFSDTLLEFEAGGLIERTPGEDFADVKIAVTTAGGSTISLFHRVLLPWIEAYWLLATTLEKVGGEPVAESQLMLDAQAMGEKRYHVGDIACPEAASSVNFKHALDAFEEFGFLARTKRGREKMIVCVAEGEGPDGLVRFQELGERLKTYASAGRGRRRLG